MIVPMKKAFIITQAKDADGALGRLRTLGVLHVEHAQAPTGKEIAAIHEDLNLINEALSVLLPFKPRAKERKVENWKFTCQHIIELHKRLSHLEEYSLNLSRLISEWREWRDFDPAAITGLAKKNILVRLYRVSEKELNNFPENCTVKVLFVSGGLAHCAVISREPVEVPFKETALPKMGLEKMQARLYEDRRLMGLIQDNLQEQAAYLNDLTKIRQRMEKELEFSEALNGMGQSGELKYLTGYIPVDALNGLQVLAKKESWGIVVKEPTEEDRVPTFIRNPRWVSVIRPVFKLIEIIPGYREMDISPLFLIFLGMFFGMIIGDAGYGAVYFLLTLFLHRKFKQRLCDARIFHLLYFFSSCAIFWGLLTGTLFGQEWHADIGLKPLVPALNDTKFLQAFCFLLGAVHLTLAQGWQGLRKLPSPAALADLGWVSLIWAAFFVARTLILDDPFPFFGKWLIMTGLFLVGFFTSPQHNILKAFGQGLGAIALGLMNSFTDVVSYVRLFAVGLAGVAIADTVNSLAAGLGSGRIFAQALIIFVGHTINIILGPMSVLVHGIRLNVLEFSSHAGLSWSGVAYQPFKE